MVKTYVLFTTLTLLLSAVVLPGTAVAQSLRLEDPIRQHERWQRDFDRDNARQSRDARDEARDQEIIRNQEDILREIRNQTHDQEWREYEREQKQREQESRERERLELSERKQQERESRERGLRELDRELERAYCIALTGPEFCPPGLR
jgi:hypothetical protein